MKLLKCSKGHYYDGDKFSSCPHCKGSQAGDSVTVSVSVPGPSEAADTTVSLPSEPDILNNNASAVPNEPVTQKSTELNHSVVSIQDGGQQDNLIKDIFDSKIDLSTRIPDDDSKTISYYSQKIPDPSPEKKEPVVGWLVCTSGEYFGQGFPLKSGRNFVGRGTEMDICLAGEKTVSRSRHAVIVYEPKERIFIAQPGDSHELFYVDNDVVLDNRVLKAYDDISIGKADFKLVPFCCKDFAWEDLLQKE